MCSSRSFCSTSSLFSSLSFLPASYHLRHHQHHVPKVVELLPQPQLLEVLPKLNLWLSPRFPARPSSTSSLCSNLPSSISLLHSDLPSLISSLHPDLLSSTSTSTSSSSSIMKSCISSTILLLLFLHSSHAPVTKVRSPHPPPCAFDASPVAEWHPPFTMGSCCC